LEQLQDVIEPIRRQTSQLQLANINISKAVESMQTIHSYFQLHEHIEKVIKKGVAKNSGKYKELVQRIQEATEFLTHNKGFRSSEAARATLKRDCQDIMEQCVEEYKRQMTNGGKTFQWVEEDYKYRDAVTEEAELELQNLSWCILRLDTVQTKTSKVYIEARSQAVDEAVKWYENRHRGEMGGVETGTDLEADNLQEVQTAAAWLKHLQFTRALLRGEHILWNKAVPPEAGGRASAYAQVVLPAIESLHALTSDTLSRLSVQATAKDRGKRKSIMNDGMPEDESAGIDESSESSLSSSTSQPYRRTRVRDRVRAKLHLQKYPEEQRIPGQKRDALRAMVGMAKKHAFAQDLILRKERPFAVLRMTEGMIEEEATIKLCLGAADESSAHLLFLKTESCVFQAALEVLLHIEQTVETDTEHYSNIHSAGSAHPLTDNVLRFCRSLVQYRLALDELKLKVGNRMPWVQNRGSAAGNQAKSCLELYVNHLMNILIEKLQAKAQAYKEHEKSSNPHLVEAYTHIFLLRNYNYLLHSQRHQVISPKRSSEAVINTFQDVLDKEIIERLKALEISEKQNYRKLCWETLAETLQDPGAVSSKDMRKQVKEGWTKFNSFFAKICEQQTPLSVPDENLKRELKIEAKNCVLEPFRHFFSKFSSKDMHFKHPEKYIVYTPELVETHIDELFSG